MNGFLLPIFDKFINIMNKVNLVELFKELFVLKGKKDKSMNDIIRLKSIAIDTFTVIKWLMLIIFIATDFKNWFTKGIVLYLLIMNVHTYFYYHVWSNRAINGLARNHEHLRRRFFSLMLAIAYNVITYTYFYFISYNLHFKFEGRFNKLLISFFHSLISTFLGGSEYVAPIDSIGVAIQTSQVLISFIFLTIILSRSDSVDIKEEQ